MAGPLRPQATAHVHATDAKPLISVVSQLACELVGELYPLTRYLLNQAPYQLTILILRTPNVPQCKGAGTAWHKIIHLREDYVERSGRKSPLLQLTEGSGAYHRYEEVRYGMT